MNSSKSLVFPAALLTTLTIIACGDGENAMMGIPAAGVSGTANVPGKVPVGVAGSGSTTPIAGTGGTAGLTPFGGTSGTPAAGDGGQDIITDFALLESGACWIRARAPGMDGKLVCSNGQIPSDVTVTGAQILRTKNDLCVLTTDKTKLTCPIGTPWTLPPGVFVSQAAASYGATGICLRTADGKGLCTQAFENGSSVWHQEETMTSLMFPALLFNKFINSYCHATETRLACAKRNDSDGMVRDEWWIKDGRFLSVATRAKEDPALLPDVCGLDSNNLVSCNFAPCSDRTGGSLRCMDPKFPPNAQTIAVPFKQIVTSPNRFCGLQLSGDVTCWHNEQQNATIPDPLPVGSYSQVATHAARLCGLIADGSRIVCNDAATFN